MSSISLTTQKILILLSTLAAVAYFNYHVMKKEQQLAEATFLYFKLMPRDPRAFLQGDYMELSYDLSQPMPQDTSAPETGYMIVKPSSTRVATRTRIQKKADPVHSGEYLLQYARPNGWQFTFGIENYYITEGTGTQFDSAQYGGIKLDSEGKPILVGLYNKSFQKINTSHK